MAYPSRLGPRARTQDSEISYISSLTRVAYLISTSRLLWPPWLVLPEAASTAFAGLFHSIVYVFSIGFASIESRAQTRTNYRNQSRFLVLFASPEPVHAPHSLPNAATSWEGSIGPGPNGLTEERKPLIFGHFSTTSMESLRLIMLQTGFRYGQDTFQLTQWSHEYTSILLSVVKSFLLPCYFIPTHILNPAVHPSAFLK